jgi:hypothetical protein
MQRARDRNSSIGAIGYIIALGRRRTMYKSLFTWLFQEPTLEEFAYSKNSEARPSTNLQ